MRPSNRERRFRHGEIFDRKDDYTKAERSHVCCNARSAVSFRIQPVKRFADFIEPSGVKLVRPRRNSYYQAGLSGGNDRPVGYAWQYRAARPRLPQQRKFRQPSRRGNAVSSSLATRGP